jgi:hypothetical protein
VGLVKKGFFFTFTALLIVFLMYLIVQGQQVVGNVDEEQLVRQRMEGINTFVVRFSQVMLSNMLEASSTRAFRSAIDYMNTTQTSFDSSQQFYTQMQSTIINGSLMGSVHPFMRNKTVEYMLDQVINLTWETYHIRLNATVNHSTLNITQVSPYTIRVRALFNYDVKSEDATWYPKDEWATAYVSVQLLRDPMMLVNTNGDFAPLIIPSNITEYQWNSSLLKQTIKSHRYTRNYDAPSYLQRFWNNSNASAYGIESFIDPDALGVTRAYNRSYIDWMFFNMPWNCSDYDPSDPFWPDVLGGPGSQWGDLHNISGITDLGFRLEDRHLTIYLNTSNNEHRDIASGGLTSTICSN